MPQFAVFFADGAGLGIEMVQALDAAHAQDITQSEGCQQCRPSCSTVRTVTSFWWRGSGATGELGQLVAGHYVVKSRWSVAATAATSCCSSQR